MARLLVNRGGPSVSARSKSSAVLANLTAVTPAVLAKIIVLVFVSIFIEGCFGPFFSHDTARSNGSGHTAFKVIGSNVAGYGFKLSHGFSKNFDLEISAEELSSGFGAKYAFLNQDRGLSLAGKVGYGATFGGHYHLGSFLTSYKSSNWEPYFNLQYIKVIVDEQDVKDANTGDVFATTPKFDFDYTQAFLGTKYWFGPHFALSFEVSDFVDHHYVDLKTNIVSISADFVH